VLVTGGLDDPVDSVLTQLVRSAAQRALIELVSEARSADGARDDLLAQSADVKRWMDELGGEGGHAACDRLVAWLRGRTGEDR
jgi:hypothetical protein